MSKKLYVHKNRVLGKHWQNTAGKPFSSSSIICFHSWNSRGCVARKLRGKQHSEEGTKSRYGAKTHPSHTVQPRSQVLSHRWLWTEVPSGPLSSALATLRPIQHTVKVSFWKGSGNLLWYFTKARLSPFWCCLELHKFCLTPWRGWISKRVKPARHHGHQPQRD